tara:strand:- start:759 stop:1451 length:693 start_codon:yes stop_codon:yes gene_type:complete
MRMETEHDARRLLITKESRIPTFSAYSLTLLLMLITVGDFAGELETTAEFTSNTPEWRITFEIQNETMQTVETVQDDETRNVLFELSEINVPDGYLIGYIDTLILPEEQDGDDDWGQCDSISADIIENQLTAQWNDPSNDLSGQDSSCLPFELNLRVYPNFSGDSITVSATNEYQALQNWTVPGWGEGDLLIELDLDVNTPLGLNSPTDSDEEITVEVTVVMFSVSIQKI